MSTLRVRRCGICKESGHNARTCSQASTLGSIPPLGSTATPPELEYEVVDGKALLGAFRLGSRHVYVSMLPSHAESVMVKYNPNIQVSCVIPPQKFNVSYATRRQTKSHLDITTPTLIMSCGYGEVPTSRSHKSVNLGYTLWAYDTERKNKIWAKPYVFANVYTGSGQVCFGGLRPSSLRQAYNQYWSSSFNNDLFREPHNCGEKSHSFNYYHNGCRCDPNHKQHTCECSRVTFHKHRGCGCRTVAASKKCRGGCERRGADGCLCCQAIRRVTAAALELDPNMKIRKKNKLAVVEGTPYPDCGCGFRHKQACGCSTNRCTCLCLCACCQKTCVHEPCVCQCCKDTCRCRCACTVEKQFSHHIKNYHESRLLKQKWTDQTPLFCGTKFWASSKSTTGILISNEKTLLSQIPRKFWRKDTHGSPMVIATALLKDDTWYFESGGFTFSLPQSSVIAN